MDAGGVKHHSGASNRKRIGDGSQELGSRGKAANSRRGGRDPIRAALFSGSGKVGVRDEVIDCPPPAPPTRDPSGGGGGARGSGRGEVGRGRGLQVLPVHTPILRLAGEPKSQKRPLCGSQGSRSVHNSLSCLAHTRQQPQPSSTKLTPAGQRGAGPAGHWHGALQSWLEAGCGGRRRSADARPSAPPGRLPALRVPPPGAGRRGVSGAYPAAEGEQEHEGAADRAQAGG